MLLSLLRDTFPHLWIEAERDEIIVQIVTPEERSSLESKLAKEDESIIDYSLGLTKVIRAVVAARKPIVGNNMMVDLVMFYHHFIRPLPGNLVVED